MKWDTGITVAEYARKMSSGSAWGGGIEMACVSQLKNVNVHVYEAARGAGGAGGVSGKGGGAGAGAVVGRGSATGFKRISAFDCAVDPERRLTVRVLYCGGVHYGQFVMLPFIVVIAVVTWR